MDAFSGDVVVSRNFTSKEVALKVAETLADIRNLPTAAPPFRGEITLACATRLFVFGMELIVAGLRVELTQIQSFEK